MRSLLTFILLAVAVLIAYWSYRIALRKGRGPTRWALLGFFFGLVAVAVVALLPSRAEPEKGQVPALETDRSTALDDGGDPGST